jgi:hypothetical protein
MEHNKIGYKNEPSESLNGKRAKHPYTFLQIQLWNFISDPHRKIICSGCKTYGSFTKLRV